MLQWAAMQGGSDSEQSPFCRASSYASTVLAVVDLILFVRPSVRLYVTRVLCDKTKQCTKDILIPHERAITLVCWYQQWLVGDALFRLKFALKVTHLPSNTPTSRFPLITSQP